VIVGGVLRDEVVDGGEDAVAWAAFVVGVEEALIVAGGVG
jgi:hypothetical protein